MKSLVEGGEIVAVGIGGTEHGGSAGMTSHRLGPEHAADPENPGHLTLPPKRS